ncbi:MAG: glycosyltransferase [Parcubacteria group bacterium]
MYDQISVVIPCFNEGETIHRNIEKINSYLKNSFRIFEIIAVNDGSTDDTLDELKRARRDFSIEIIDNSTNAGKGKAVRDGIMRSRYGLVMFLDADLAIPIEELEKFAMAISQGCDIAIASRFVPGLKVLTPVLWYRKIMERAFRMLRKIIHNSWKIEDTQCGFKVFRRDVAQKIFSRATVNRFAFDAEIIFIAKKLGYAIKELPITLQNPRTTHIRIFFDPLNMFIALLEIRHNDIRGIYRWK